MPSEMDLELTSRLAGMEADLRQIAEVKTKFESGEPINGHSVKPEHIWNLIAKFNKEETELRASQPSGRHRLLSAATYPPYDHYSPEVKFRYLVRQGFYGFIVDSQSLAVFVKQSEEDYSEVILQEGTLPIFLLDPDFVFQRLKRRRRGEDEIMGFFKHHNLTASAKSLAYDLKDLDEWEPKYVQRPPQLIKGS